MKKMISLILFLSFYAAVNAQLYVQSGATLHIGGTLTLHNEDFIRSSGAGPAISYQRGSNVIFTGNADNTIAGDIDFLNVEIAKEAANQVSLLNFNGQVRRQLDFTTGLLNLNGQTLLIADTGMLVNENESSRIIGPTGGAVQTTVTLNQPRNINPGNIGAAVTSTKNLGEVVIQRTYVDSYAVPLNSINRYYSVHFINPANDNDLDATLRLFYFDAELNGADESRLVQWKREDLSAAWTEQGPTANVSRDMNEDWVELSHIGTLSNWTLAELSGTLPVTFTALNITCSDNAAIIHWQTATEIDVDHFEVQRSVNGADWTTIASQGAAGQSSTLQDYTYTDREQVSSVTVFYRIMSVDRDGARKYTEARASACASTEQWKVWPNPVQQELHIRFTTEEAYSASLQLFDNKGALVRQWQQNVTRGVNQFTVDLKDLAAGAYHIVIYRYDNRQQQSVEIIKQ